MHTCSGIAPIKIVEREDHIKDGKERAMVAIATRLIENGYQIACPEWDHDGYLKVTTAPHAQCDLTFTDTHADWDYRPFRGHIAAPKHATAMIAAILTPRHPSQPTTPAPEQSGHPLLTAVREQLADSGLRFGWLHLTPDGSHACLTADNPAQPHRGKVHLGDHYDITWHVRYTSQDTRTALDPAEIASTITRALAAGGWPPAN
jgi:hypothetical protein